MPNTDELRKIDYHISELQSTVNRMISVQQEQGADLKEVKKDQKGHVEQYNIDKIENTKHKVQVTKDLEHHENSLNATKADVADVKVEVAKLTKYMVIMGLIVAVAVLVGPETAKNFVVSVLK